ncbi:MAG: succinylglutamate desuccinylase/aspartoacylase family protein [Methanobrevibacter sp.]|jgi:predicted deacylase|nr:succinylglutamate desuccinylase/aspartoacylase family protein [Methanobrevibacter sp.]
MAFTIVVEPVEAKATVSYLKLGTGGDITKNYHLYKSLPKTSLTKKVLMVSKKGTPVVKFGGGKGPKTIIIAGVHGNELSSQSSAIKLINYLNKKKKIKGTIYVIPFFVPKSSQKNTRYFKGKDLNSLAENKKSTTYKLIKYIKSKKVSIAGDFHTTVTNGDPGKTIVMGSKSPSPISGNISIYISKKTKYPYRNYNYAGEAYVGAIEDALNKINISSVTCEVNVKDGKTSKSSITASYKMMIALLKFSKNI